MDIRQQPQVMTLPSPPVDLWARRERHGESENQPIDLARLDNATNGAFVVDWELGRGA